MPAWIINLLLALLERWGEKLIGKAVDKWDREIEHAEVKDDLKKAVKIKNRKHRADNILNAIKR